MSGLPRSATSIIPIMSKLSRGTRGPSRHPSKCQRSILDRMLSLPTDAGSPKALPSGRTAPPHLGWPRDGPGAAQGRVLGHLPRRRGPWFGGGRALEHVVLQSFWGFETGNQSKKAPSETRSQATIIMVCIVFETRSSFRGPALMTTNI